MGDSAGKGPDPRSRPELFAQGHVVVNIAVDEAGRVLEPRVVESEPPGLMDRHVLEVLGSSRFRPRMNDGEVVRSDSVAFRHEFRYLKSLAASRPASGGDEAEAGEKGAPIAYPDSPEDKAPAADPAGE
jgi:TonB family protein